MSTFSEIAGADPTTTRYRAIAALRDAGTLSRAELARRTTLAPSTITAVVRTLADEGIAVETAGHQTNEPTRTGPRSRGISLNPLLGHVAGIDFGFRTVRLLITDLSGREVDVTECRLPDPYTAEEGLRVTGKMLREALGRTGLSPSDVAAAGVALPGPVDTLAQQVIGSAILPGWAGWCATEISEQLGIKTVIENDANLAALGEHHYGAARGSRDSLTIKFHSGIGAGVIVRDELVSGQRGGAGEIGHTLVDTRGPLCRCGKRGCLDTYASVPAVLATMTALHGSIDLPAFLNLLDAQDPGALRVAEDAADLVGHAVATACLLLAPESVIIIGAMARAGEVVLRPIREALQRDLLPNSSGTPRVLRGQLGDRHTAMGAIALALDTVGWLPGTPRQQEQWRDATGPSGGNGGNGGNATLSRPRRSDSRQDNSRP